MDDAGWTRRAALGGPAFVVLALVGGFLPGAPPAMDCTPDEALAWFADHDKSIRIGAVLISLGVIGLLWWFGSLWRAMVRAEGGQPRLAVVAGLGLVLFNGFMLLTSAVLATGAFHVLDVGSGTKIYLTSSYVLGSMAFIGAVAFVAGVTSLAYRTKMHPLWMNALGWLASAGMLAGSLNMANGRSLWTILGVVGSMVFMVWLLAVSWDLWRRPAGATAG